MNAIRRFRDRKPVFGLSSFCVALIASKAERGCLAGQSKYSTIKHNLTSSEKWFRNVFLYLQSFLDFFHSSIENHEFTVHGVMDRDVIELIGEFGINTFNFSL
jgi:hypothetical protein